MVAKASIDATARPAAGHYAAAKRRASCATVTAIRACRATISDHPHSLQSCYVLFPHNLIDLFVQYSNLLPLNIWSIQFIYCSIQSNTKLFHAQKLRLKIFIQFHLHALFYFPFAINPAFDEFHAQLDQFRELGLTRAAVERESMGWVDGESVWVKKG